MCPLQHPPFSLKQTEFGKGFCSVPFNFALWSKLISKRLHSLSSIASHDPDTLQCFFSGVWYFLLPVAEENSLVTAERRCVAFSAAATVVLLLDMQ